jgi:hypothetical protein
MSDSGTSILVAIVALGGVLVGVAASTVTDVFSRRQKSDEIFLQALESR